MGELLLFIAGLVLFLYLGTNLLFGIARRDTLSDEWREESEAAGKSRLGRQLQTLRIDIALVLFLLLVLLVLLVLALLALAERTGVKDLKSLATPLNVGFRLWASIRVTLEEQADLLRAKQREGSMRLLNRKTLESLFPLLLVSLPIFGVLVGFPLVELSKFFRLFSGYYG